MQLAIVSVNCSLYSTKRLIEAAEQQGFSVCHINPLETQLTLSHNQPAHQLTKQNHAPYMIIPRIAASVSYLGCALLRQLHATGGLSINTPEAIHTASDQLLTLQQLQRHRLPFPRSAFGCRPEQLANLLAIAGPLPVVIKHVSGTHGEGVTLVHTQQHAEQVLGQALAERQNLIVQQYIAEAKGRDIRAFVIGNRVYAAIERHAQAGEFRANLHLGGRCQATTLTPQEQQLAVAAAQAIGLNVAGVDILRTQHGPLIIEVNASPGLEGIEQATGLDIATEIVRFAHSQRNA